MRKLKVEMGDLGLAMDMSDLGDDSSHYLDLETGKVIFVGGEICLALNGILGDLDDDEDPTAVAEAIKSSDLADWERQAVQEAWEVDQDAGKRYVEIPHSNARDDYQLMVEFIDTVADEHLRELLEVAIDGKGAFGRFKSVLGRSDKELDRWYAFKNEEGERQARRWLKSLEIEPIQ
jgi:hypothetical protein